MKGKTQQEIADELDMPRRTVARYRELAKIQQMEKVDSEPVQSLRQRPELRETDETSEPQLDELNEASSCRLEPDIAWRPNGMLGTARSNQLMSSSSLIPDTDEAPER